MHNKSVSDLDGEFRTASPEKYRCRKCGKSTASLEIWDSSDGAYTDYKYTCGVCGHYWWIEGPDA